MVSDEKLPKLLYMVFLITNHLKKKQINDDNEEIIIIIIIIIYKLITSYLLYILHKLLKIQGSDLLYKHLWS